LATALAMLWRIALEESCSTKAQTFLTQMLRRPNQVRTDRVERFPPSRLISIPSAAALTLG